MLTFHEMTPRDKDLILPMVAAFYRSGAVEHPVPPEILAQTFDAAADPQQSLLRGILLRYGGAPAGFLYLTGFFSAEAGGLCVMIEELFVLPELRGKGLGSQALTWLEGQYPTAKRFRLEVTKANQGAVRLYQRYGYRWLHYEQMIKER